jgi:hypothetical protein
VSGRDTGRTMSQQNIEAGREFVEAVNRGDVEAALRLVHPEVIFEPLRVGNDRVLAGGLLTARGRGQWGRDAGPRLVGLLDRRRKDHEALRIPRQSRGGLKPPGPPVIEVAGRFAAWPE